MTLTKAKAVIAKLLEDYPALSDALDAAPLQTSVQEKLVKCQEFAKKCVERTRRNEINSACRTIKNYLQIGSYN